MSDSFEKANRTRERNANDRAQVIVLHLALRDCNVIELAHAAGVSRSTADRYLHHALYGMVHIARWDYLHTLGSLSSIWRLGACVNAPKPPALEKRSHVPIRGEPDPEEWFDDRAREQACRTRPFRHPMDVAFYGAAA